MFIIPIRVNWIEVDEEVNKTRKFDVTVEITGFTPNSIRMGPIMRPPPIPTNPAITPAKKAYIGNIYKMEPFQIISC